MHILHIPISLPLVERKSAGTYIVDLVRAQASNNIDMEFGVLHVNPVRFIDLLGSDNSRFIDVSSFSGLERLYIKNRYFFNRNKRRSKSWVRFCVSAFHDYSKKYGIPDLIHAHSGRGPGEIAAILKKEYGIPFVVQEHNPVFLYEDKLTESECQRLRNVYDGANFICPVSISMKSKISDLVDSGKIRVTPNVVSRKFFIKSKKIGVHRNFTIVSRLDLNKNVQMSVMAFYEATKENDSIYLNIYGQGSELNGLQELINRLGINKKVNFMGNKDKAEIARALTNSEGLLLSSYKETFGLPVLESLFCGCPVISTKSGGPEEIADNVSGVHLVEVDDMNAMKIEIKRLIDCPATSDERINFASEAVKFYGEIALVNMWFDIYKDAVKK